jgi:uncharacterized protein Yka (UPF0111/DUF47 family)
MQLRPRRPDTALLDLLDESGENVSHTALLLRELFSEYPESNGLGSDIRDHEHRGDRIAHDILARIATQAPRRAAFDPADVHALACALDDIVDFAEEAADQLRRYDVEAPMEPAQKMAEVLVTATEEVTGGLRGLRNGYDASRHLVEIHRLENAADEIVRAAVASLFVHGIDPMVVIRWKDIFESLESAVDACETAANVLEGIALKRGRRG